MFILHVIVSFLLLCFLFFCLFIFLFTVRTLVPYLVVNKDVHKTVIARPRVAGQIQVGNPETCPAIPVKWEGMGGEATPATFTHHSASYTYDDIVCAYGS